MINCLNKKTRFCGIISIFILVLLNINCYKNPKESNDSYGQIKQLPKVESMSETQYDVSIKRIDEIDSCENELMILTAVWIKRDTLSLGVSGDIVYNLLDMPNTKMEIHETMDYMREMFVKSKNFDFYEDSSESKMFGVIIRQKFFKGNNVILIVYHKNRWNLSGENAKHECGEDYDLLPNFGLEGEINDTSITLIGGIKVGMTKQEFISIVFKGCSIVRLKDALKSARVIEIGDIFGEYINVSYAFEEDTLKRIVITTEWEKF